MPAMTGWQLGKDVGNVLIVDLAEASLLSPGLRIFDMRHGAARRGAIFLAASG
jgi:hypothetical protein